MEALKIVDAHVLLGEEEYLRLDDRELLQRMDAHHVETAIARAMGPELAYSFANGNERLLKLDPRIKVLATANPWAGTAAANELDRSHDLGAVGLFLHPSRQGFMPTESVVAPLIRKAIGWNWPIMFHTGSYTYSDLLAVGELCKRYPQGNFIAGFGGFSDMWFDLPRALLENPNLYLETSMNWCFAIEALIRADLTDRILFASAEPRNGYDVALKVWSMIKLTADEREKIFHLNAERLFSL